MTDHDTPNDLSFPFIVEKLDTNQVKLTPSNIFRRFSAAKLVGGISGLVIFGYVLSALYSNSSSFTGAMNLYSSSEHNLINAQAKFLSTFSRVAEFKESRANGLVVISKLNKFIGFSTVEGTVEVWDIESLSQLSAFSYGYNTKISSIAFTNDNKHLVASSEHGYVKVWSLESKAEIANFWHSSSVKAIAITSDDVHILTQTSESVSVWNLPYRKLAYEFKLGDTTISEMALSRDDKYIVVSNTKGYIKVWNFKTGVVAAIFNHGGRFTGLKLSDDNLYVVSAGHGYTVKVWNIQTQEKVAQVQHQDYPFATAISSSSKYVLSGGRSRTVKVMDLATGEEVGKFSHDYQTACVAVTKDSRFALTGDHGGVLKLWNIEAKTEVGKYELGAWVESIVLSEDEKYVAVASLNGSVYLWTL